ncbi:MAG: hypothetical protein K1V76_04465 [Candidatus Amulumruptor sp.]
MSQPISPAPSTSPADISIVRNRIQWLVPSGVIARYISPNDFESLGAASGLYIPRGVTALIYVDGTEAARLTEGSYDFVSKKDIDNLLAQKATPGLLGRIERGCTALLHAITGRKVSDSIQDSSRDLSSLRTMEDVIKRLRPDSAISAYLKVDSPFDVILGSGIKRDGCAESLPLQIICKHLTSNIGITISLTIADFDAFRSHYLISRNIVTVSDIAHDILPAVRFALSQCLRDTHITEYGIDAATIDSINAVLAQGIYLPGISLVRIVEVTCGNDGIERLRHVAEEIYLSEQELSYAIRTNDFRNRLATVENDRKISDAKSALDLHTALGEINRDQALNDDELEEFYMLLSRKKTIREATNAADAEKALSEIERNRLIDADSLDVLRSEIALRRTTESHASVRAELSNTIELDDIMQQHVADSELRKADTDTELLKAKLAQEGMMDDYADSRARRRIADELEAEKARDEHKMSKLERLAELTRKQQAEWAEQERQKTVLEHSHEENLADKNIRIQMIRSGMTAEQILAEQGAMLDAAAQSELARSLGNARVAEAEKQMLERQRIEAIEREKAQRDDRDVMIEKMQQQGNSMLEAMTKMMEITSATRAAGEQTLRDQVKHEQTRNDDTYRTVLNHEEKLHDATVNAIRASQGTPEAPITRIICPKCHNHVEPSRFCKSCGAELPSQA